ncbi:Septum site-determining protein MinC [uncultured Candidatus Thioglobus sp.]|nr:Septum site-determining protein MinC [uncultured Candidatus Thioglobus sp.]
MMKKTDLIEVEVQNEAFYTLKVLSKNTDELFDEIADLSTSNKGKFQHAPVILEIENKHFQANELAVLIEILTQNNMVVIGIRSQVQELIDFARFSGLAVFDKSISALKNPETTKPSKKKDPTPEREYRLPKIVVGEVASAQQVFAKDSDLVLLGAVKVDGEVIAHGSVSSYREMQGKVFAGIDGDEKATIFVHSFDAQLVSIAGIYKRFDVVPAKLQLHSVMIDLKEGKLRFQIIK